MAGETGLVSCHGPHQLMTVLVGLCLEHPALSLPPHPDQAGLEMLKVAGWQRAWLRRGSAHEKQELLELLELLDSKPL